jgi:DNA-binding LytR/AlgR family response regulator
MMNEPIQVLVVDDEPIARDILQTYIVKVPFLQLAGTCKNALEAFGFLSNNKVSLLLLDINMPEITGINFLKTLKDPPLVIFTTAYAEYAVESYDLNAVDYLLKPISFDRFLKGANKAADILRATMEPAANVAAPAAVADNMMFVRSEGKLVRIDLEKLWMIEGLKDYVRLWTETGKTIVHGTMKSFEEQLSAQKNFIRVHKSYIVNTRYVNEVDGNSLRIKDQLITIGSTYRDEVLAVFNRYKLL